MSNLTGQPLKRRRRTRAQVKQLRHQIYQALAADHTALGLDARVVTISQVVAGAFGDFSVNAAGLPARDLCEVLRNFLQGCAYSQWGVRYLLIGGDTQIVPVRRILKQSGWESRSGNWTDSAQWNVFSAVCRSWWPDC